MADGSSGRVLIVEDDTAVAEAITAALAEDHQVFCVLTGSEAIAAICENSFGLVLLDHRLPDLLGTDLLKLIKGFPRHFDRRGNVTQAGGKQVDPVNFTRLEDRTLPGTNQPDPRPPMRRRILEYVTRLVTLRTTHPALGVNDMEFLHVDLNGKRALVWKRGMAGQDPVVVLANCSDFVTANASSASAEYVVPHWPSAAGRRWREDTQGRLVPDNWIGREPIFPWEAKVYTLV